MMDLHDRLRALAGPPVPVTEEQAAADLARGRRALRRRRTVSGTATGVFAVAAAAAAIGYGVADRPTDRPAPPAAASPSTTSRSPIGSARLVAYTGPQPKGYTIDKVPAGWEIQGVNNYNLTLAPAGAANKDPEVFVGKIAIMLQSKDEHGTPTGRAVHVGSKDGVLVAPGDLPHGRVLYVKQANGVNLIVQIWNTQGWSDDSILEFAAGIHVLPNAQQGVG